MRLTPGQLRRIIREEARRAMFLTEQVSGNKPKLYFLIGPPAVGKSEWIKQNLTGDVAVVNRDEMVEKIAKESGVGTYDEMYTRPPKEITPDGMPSKEKLQDPSASDEVDAYVDKVRQAAESFNTNPDNSVAVKKYGKLVPFNKDAFETVIVKFGVKPQFIVPFEYEKIKRANDDVTSLLNLTRKESAKKGKSIAIDMVSMSRGERDQHRKFIVNAITDSSDGKPEDVNQYYDQIAIVFAPESGYTPEMIEQIKKRAAQRSEEIKSSGGSKTIPPAAYDRMFASYAEPTADEGFVSIKYVGVPSLQSLKAEARVRDKNYVLLERWQRLAGVIK